LQADGWIVRNAVVWHRPDAAAPTPADDRLATRYQLLFLLVRRPRYHLDLDPVRVPYTGDRAISRRAHRGGTRPAAARSARSPWPPPDRPGRPGGAVRGRNPGDVWALPTAPSDSGRSASFPAHPGRPAAFPVEVPLRCIAAGCPPGGVVLDPFSGTGTTGLAARHLGRGYVGVTPDPADHDVAAAALARQAPDPDRRGNAATDPGPGGWAGRPGRPRAAASPDAPGGIAGRRAA
jgi:site-specific DNA-methyltransferase (cytosine-N4-specific)